VYSNLGDDYSLGASIRIPVLDWGQGRNTYRNALSSRELVEVQMRQNRVDFEQQIFLQVMQFNMQGNSWRIASVADTIAQKSYEVAKQRYLIGRVSVTDLNIADTEKDAAKRTLINELSTYGPSSIVCARAPCLTL
jgi:outer membrane protein TolC